ncbi:DUF1102 domain-containing protein [Halocatena marina]|uniref:DUF1102 domain-containing protein n=1 Tax=Halocatena marina TaxID=2934937 RepID=UPI00361DD9A7
MTAERSVDVKVAGDKGAYLALQPAQGPNGNYAKMENGQLAVNLDGDAKEIDGKGVNPNAVTHFDKVFTVTNKGSQPVEVTITEKSSTNAVTFYRKNNPENSLEDGSITVNDGDSVAVGIKVDTRGEKVSNGEKLLDAIQVQANAEHGNATSS